MSKLTRCFLPVLFLAGALATRAALPFPQDGSDLKPEAAARFGVLPNGVRYVIFPNHEPRNRASLRLLVLSGSLEENDDQQGLAHFLEHMAFNGSAHYAPGTLIEYFQRLGMSFGGDTNAYTSFDHTAYKIELPNTKPATIAEGLQVFSDMAGSLLLRPDMIAKERPIILSEKRDRDSIDYRQFVASFKFLLPNARLPKRLPIGLQSVIEQATRDRFVELYNTWYRPERMAVVVVGEVDPAAVAEPDRGRLRRRDRPRAHPGRGEHGHGHRRPRRACRLRSGAGGARHDRVDRRRDPLRAPAGHRDHPPGAPAAGRGDRDAKPAPRDSRQARRRPFHPGERQHRRELRLLPRRRHQCDLHGRAMAPGPRGRRAGTAAGAAVRVHPGGAQRGGGQLPQRPHAGGRQRVHPPFGGAGRRIGRRTRGKGGLHEPGRRSGPTGAGARAA